MGKVGKGQKLACAERIEIPETLPVVAEGPKLSEVQRRAEREQALARKQVYSRFTLAQLLKGPDSELEEEIHDRLTSRSFDDLSPDEQLFYAVVELEGEVNNGGFSQYFFNNAGNHARLAREGLVRFEEPQPDGGHPFLGLVDCAFEAFPRQQPSVNALRREDQLARWGASEPGLFSRLDLTFYRTRHRFSAVAQVRAHPESFPTLDQPLPLPPDAGASPP